MDAARNFLLDRPQLATRRAAVDPLWIALAVTALVTALRTFDTVGVDVAWQLWIAGRLHAGARLYRDIIEVNPPLWFWMAESVDAIARLLKVGPASVLVVAIGGLAALSLAATDRFLTDLRPSRRAMLLVYAAATLMAMPWVQVGQREQIVLIAVLPYAALAAARAEGRHMPVTLAAFIGAGAALGLALKHYFLIVPVLLELWIWVRRERQWRPFRPELVAMTAMGGLYAAAILIWARAYLTDALPLIRLAYANFGAPHVKDLFGLFILLGLGIFSFVAANWRMLGNGKAPFASALMVAATGFAAAYFIQSKGWLYHAIPLVGCASLALAALLAETPKSPALLRILSPAVLALPLLFATQERLHPAEPSAALENAIFGLRSGDSVGFVVVDNAIPWSVTLQHQFKFPSRYMAFWMLNAIVHNERLGNPDPRLAKLGGEVVSETVEDFRCLPPKAIIVTRPAPGKRGFDILRFFRRDPQFVELLSHYRADVPREGFQRYDRISELPPADFACRAGI